MTDRDQLQYNTRTGAQGANGVDHDRQNAQQHNVQAIEYDYYNSGNLRSRRNVTPKEDDGVGPGQPPGKTGEDIAHWVESGMQGPPPAAPVAGISPMAPDKGNTLMLDLSAGNYALLCFVPDAKDGKPHIAHGMIYNFKV